MMNKTIPVFDEAGNYIKDVFPRYAIQRVLKGQAIWIKRSSAIQVLKPCPILSVFPSNVKSLDMHKFMCQNIMQRLFIIPDCGFR